MKYTFTLAVAMTLLVGCSHTIRNADRAYQDVDGEAKKLLVEMRKPAVPGQRETVTISTSQWVEPVPMAVTAPKLPAALNCDPGFKTLEPMGLLEFAQAVSESCKMAVRVTPDALAAFSGGENNGASSGTSAGAPLPVSGMPLPNLPMLPPVGGTGAGFGSGGRATGALLSNIEWKGPLAGLLDLVASRYGLSWRYNERNNSVSIFHVDSRTFQLDAFPNQVDIQSTTHNGMSSQLGSGGGGVGGGGGSSGGSSSGGVSGTVGSSQTTVTSMKSSLYTDVESSIKVLLTPGIGRVALSQSTGAVTVTDTPDVLDRIGNMLDRENNTLTKQVTLHAKVLSLTLNDGNEVGVNWDVVYKSLSRQFEFKTPFQPASSAGTLGASVINTGKFAGTNVIVSALSTLGTVNTITSPSLKTLNLRPAPIQIARQIGYIQSAQISQTEGAGTLGGLTPGFVTVGFNMTVVPRLLAQSEEMILQYSINISALNELRSEEAGGTKIEMPDIDTRNFNSEVRLHAGETLILHGFEQDNHTSNRRGMGSPYAWMLGGSAKGQRQRTAIVILITPEVGSSLSAMR
ncbi:PilN family type IVB pilus formation outer membrane protein [Stenotrophomonas maltophilia]|uniref:PilN family type IVB pilus formation outer membrane protein n=1 Tax=Stenotrophomonas maltophilia TaxID=40324 RepID=UPI00244A8683|nr:PilN family type IVB pilus formation outer membrane protein [Stenotrophomonas maltophilia]MDH0740995.1 PilN family type IVB pilus formation outer membrane protein [Stenotrophomonas maltophilia]MDH1328431.1 PilN family type IVB pilus formation outer membrane protein [Stenotrophomonas maltophilia]